MPKQEHANRKNRMVTTGIVLGVFLVLASLYSFAIPLKKLTIEGNIVVWNILFIGLSFITLIYYRWKSWEKLTKRKSLSKKKL